MPRALQIILFSVCLVGVVLSSQRIWRIELARGLESRLTETEMGISPVVSPNILEQAEHIVPVEGSEGDAIRAVAARVERAASHEPIQQALPQFCTALSLYGSALRSAPFDAMQILGWANRRQLVAGHQCGLPFTEGDYHAAISFAIARAPLDPEVRFQAGLLYLWDGERAGALEQFRYFLEYALDLRESQETYIVSAVRTPDELLALIPPRLPQAIRWSSIFESRRPEDYKVFRAAFGTIQRRALDTLVQEYVRGRLHQSIFRNHLVLLSEQAATEPLRRTLDSTIARFLEERGESDVAAYFKKRSSLDAIERVVSWQARDRSPERSQLALWGRDDLVSFDTRGVSIGFFLAADQRLQLLELQGLDGGQPPHVDQVRLFVSLDNKQWSEVPIAENISSFVIQGRPIMAIELNERLEPFWKLHFQTPGNGTFRNYLHRMIRVYGTTSREEQR